MASNLKKQPRPAHPPYWPEATAALSGRDRVMKELIARYCDSVLTCRGDAFFTLARAIAGQQISVKAADSVWKKLETALGVVAPASVAGATTRQLRGAGLSQQKARYLRELAAFFRANRGIAARWRALPDEALIKELVRLDGIGRWTAEMFLIFHLRRPDVFPQADLGLLKAIHRHYNNGNPIEKQDIMWISDRWRPWRTVATWYLWRALDPEPVLY